MVPDRTGEQFGSYRLDKLIGTGGFATVYLGIHTVLGTRAAIKLLHAHLTGNETEEFVREARMIAGLEHPHIVQVKDFATQDGVPYLVLEYAPFGSLRSLYTQEGAFSLGQIVSFIQQAASALAYAHERKIIHRDIKPDNMLLNTRREVVLGDFGIAVLVQTTHAAEQSLQGTFAYSAPEQLQGHALPASDQYALAVVAYEWICGQRPFSGTVPELIGQHASAQPPRPSLLRPGLSPQIEQVLLQALAKDPRQRFPTITVFASALASACQGNEALFDQTLRYSRPLNIAPGAAPTILPPPILPTELAAPFTQAPRTVRAPQTGTQQTPPIPARPVTTNHTPRPQVYTPQPPPGLPNPPPSPPSTHPRRTATRRKLLIGLGSGLGVLALGGGTLWFKVISPFLDSFPYTYNGHKSRVNAVAWSPDGTRIASCDSTATVHIWNATDGSHVQHSQWGDFSKANVPGSDPMQARALAWGKNSPSLAIGFSTMPTVIGLNGVNDPSIDAVGLLDSLMDKPLGGVRKGGFTVAWSPDGTRLASASYYLHTVDVWEAVSGKAICRYSKHDPNTGMDQVAWSPDGTRIASAGGDGTVQVWDSHTAAHIITYKAPNNSGRTRSVSWSPDGTRIASAGDDETVSVWNVSTGKVLFTGANPGASMGAVAWSPNGKWIATGSDDAKIFIWDAQNGKKLTTLQRNGLASYGHTENVNAVAWSPDSAHLASASDDMTVIVWKIAL